MADADDDPALRNALFKAEKSYVTEKSRLRQFTAISRKNLKLKTRGCCMCCCSVTEIVVPAFFFAVMCLPKLFLGNVHYTNEFFDTFALADPVWAQQPWEVDCAARSLPGEGEESRCLNSREGSLVCNPATAQETLMYYAPKSGFSDIVMRDVVRRLACEVDTSGNSFLQDKVFYEHNKNPAPFAALEKAVDLGLRTEAATEATTPTVNTTTYDADKSDDMDEMDMPACESLRAPAEILCSVCQGEAYASVSDECDLLFDLFIKGFATERQAMDSALEEENLLSVYALVVLDEKMSTDLDLKYTLRVNGSKLTDREERDEQFEGIKFVNRWDAILPNAYQKYLFGFVNIQNAVDGALMSYKLANGDAAKMAAEPVKLNTMLKSFPWLEFDINLGGAVSSNFLPLLFIFAFVSTTTLLMKTIVMEKELRLREGMLMMGLDNSMYWLSWFCIHFASLFVTMILCTIVGLYPFSNTNAGIQFVFLVFWSMALINFCYFLSCFFSKANIASIVSSLLFVSSLAIGIGVDIGDPLGSPAWVLICLHPGCAVYMWGNILAVWELGNVGINNGNMDESILPKYNFTAGIVMGMIILDTFLYAFLTWYCDKVIPSAFGTVYKPWFLFTRGYWEETGLLQPIEKEEGLLPEDVERASSMNPNVEPLPEGAERTAAIRVTNLRKQFGEVSAVDGLSFSFAQNQISCLLGHNGAGKTTTISMLSGMIPATSGEATVGGYDMKTEMWHIRQSLGVCPQFDILWPNLTVREHLTLYSNFQGIPAAAVETEIRELLAEVGLLEKIDAYVFTLSGGQKRKLSVSIAFLGNPKVVFLDEPTSGMDPHSRRMTWDVIRSHRQNRCIVLTTHFMDEADLLSDRIAIMSAGKLACLGTSVFLKSRFGLGYSITLNKRDEHVSAEPVAKLIQGHVPGAKTLSSVGTELSFKLPSKETHLFADMLDALEDRLAALGIESYGISNTTLEEVFLSIAEGKGSGHQISKDTTAAPVASAARRTPAFVDGSALKVQQFKALMTKRLINMRRDPYSLLTQLIGPVVFVMIALSVSLVTPRDVKFQQYEPFTMDRDMLDGIPPTLAVGPNAGPDAGAVEKTYMDLHKATPTENKNTLAGRDCYCWPKGWDEAMAQDYNFRFGDAPPKTELEAQTCKEVGDYQVSEECQGTVENSLDYFLLNRQKAYTACHNEEGSCDGLYIEHYNKTAREFNHTLLLNPTALLVTPVAMNTANSAIWRLLNGDKGSITTVLHPMEDPIVPGTESTDGMSILGLVVAIFLGLGISTLSASFAVFLVWERMNNAKHLQMVSGVDKVLFWCSSFLADMLNYMVPFVAIMICFAAFNSEQFVKNDGLAGIAVLLLCFGWAAIPMSYLLHFPFVTPMNALVTQMAACSFFMMGTLISSVIMEVFVVNDDTKAITGVTKWIFRLFPHYSVTRGVFDISYNYQVGQLSDGPKDVFEMDIVGWPCVFMLLEGMAFFALTLFIEFKESMLKEQGVSAPVPPEEDEDVVAERRNVQDPQLMAEEILVVNNIAKTYPNGHVAVQPMAFSVGKSECFGLLGINGAGKTSTFRMLTGEFVPSGGDATVKGREADGAHTMSITKDLNEARKVMGYCPQFDGIQPNMTAREHLRFYAQIRGVAPAEIEAEVDYLLERMDLTVYADRQCGGYSGGNKRKLSVAIALVGDPPLVLLDEPSTGMDPEARRFMWDVISSTMENRCVVLTSHSMEECEALCHKVGIMVKGQFRCFGSIQHLKNRFSEGYHLDFTVGPENLEKTQDFIQKSIPGVALVYSHGTALKYQVSKDASLPFMFRQLEKIKAQGDVFDDYSITQTTLEQVFIKFAGESDENVQP